MRKIDFRVVYGHSDGLLDPSREQIAEAGLACRRFGQPTKLFVQHQRSRLSLLPLSRVVHRTVKLAIGVIYSWLCATVREVTDFRNLPRKE